MKKFIFLLLLFPAIKSFSQVIQAKTNLIDINPGNADISTILPVIKWEYPSMEYTNSQEHKVVVKASVSSSIPLKSVMLNVKSGKNQSTRGSMPVNMKDTSFTAKVDQEVYLTDGENIIEIMAENTDGGIVRDTRTILVGMNAISDAVAIDRKDYALLFATDKLDNFPDLVNPIYVANSIAKELKDRYGFQTEVVENATQNEVFLKLREYAQKNYKPQDQLFIFFAGHGVYDEVYGEGYVVASNSQANDPSKDSYISHNRLRSIINNIPCRHIFLAMDVCFGGTFDPILAASRGIDQDTNNRAYLAKKLSMKTRKYLTSGSKEYVPDGAPGHHSPFAQKFLEALTSDGGADRILVLDEIKLYMDRLQTTPRFGGFGSDEQGSDFVFVAK